MLEMAVDRTGDGQSAAWKWLGVDPLKLRLPRQEIWWYRTWCRKTADGGDRAWVCDKEMFRYQLSCLTGRLGMSECSSATM